MAGLLAFGRWLLLSLALKAAMVLAFAGGPWLVGQALAPVLGHDAALALAALPPGALLYAALFLEDRSSGRLDRAVLRLGLLGAVALAATNAYAFWVLATGPARPDQALVMVGIGAGSASSLLYGLLALRRLGWQNEHHLHKEAGG